MTVAEIRKLSTKELTKQSTDLRQQINEMKQQVVLGEMTNVRAIRNKRRDLARVLTVLSEQLAKEAK